MGMLALLAGAVTLQVSPLTAQQKVPLVLNHLVIVLDSATYRDVAGSGFISGQFAAVESGLLEGYDGGRGIRLFGKYDFVQFEQPGAGARRGRGPGDIGLVLAVEHPGGLTRLKTLGSFASAGVATVAADEPIHANRYFEKSDRIRPAGRDSTSSHSEFEIMEYTRDAATDLSRVDSLPIDNLANARFLRRNFDAGKLFSRLTGATLAIPVDDIAKIAHVLERDSITVLHEGEGAIIKLDGVTLRLIPPWTGAGVKQLQFALTRDVPANPVYRFGPHSELRFGPGPIAVWDFHSR